MKGKSILWGPPTVERILASPETAEVFSDGDLEDVRSIIVIFGVWRHIRKNPTISNLKGALTYALRLKTTPGFLLTKFTTGIILKEIPQEDLIVMMESEELKLTHARWKDLLLSLSL